MSAAPDRTEGLRPLLPRATLSHGGAARGSARNALACVALSSAVAALSLCGAAAAREPFLTHVAVFSNEGASFYRIPSIVVADDGTVLAFCNRRVGSPHDRVPHVELVLRRSKDGGKTWLPMQDLRAREEWVAAIGSAIADRKTGEIMVQYSWHPGTEAARREQETSPEYTGLMMAKSTDSGLTWRFEPMRIAPNSVGKVGASHGSGAGITLRYGPKKGRLLMPARYGYKGKGYNCANYSDDHGKTWRTSEPVQPDTGEACLVELPDGTIYLNSRSCSGDGRRKVALSHDGGETFGDFSISEVLTECNFGTNAALLGVPAAVHGRFFVLFSNPPYNTPGMNFLRDRRRMTVRLSLDGAKTWPLSRLVFEGPSGYSSLAMTKEGEFLLLYERGEKIYRDRGISVARFDLEWLTDGRDLGSLSPRSGE